MDRLSLVRYEVHELLKRQDDPVVSRRGLVHLYGVSAVCTLLAVRRGLDSELCAIAGMLHDIHTFMTGDPTDHARLSAVDAERVLYSVGGFSPAEIALVSKAIARHSVKAAVDGPYDELLKDADVLQYYLYSPHLAVGRLEKARNITEEEASRIRRWRDTLIELGVEPRIPTDGDAA